MPIPKITLRVTLYEFSLLEAAIQFWLETPQKLSKDKIDNATVIQENLDFKELLKGMRDAKGDHQL